jgi:hypothetical protein
VKSKKLERSLQKLEAAGDELLEEHGLILRKFGNMVVEIAESGNFAKFYMLVSVVNGFMQEALNRAMKTAKGRPASH